MRRARASAIWIAAAIIVAVAAPTALGSGSARKASATVVANPASRSHRMHGVVFYKLPSGGKRTCSGTVVDSTYKSLVWTAGSCVADPATQRFRTGVVFVPGYRSGDAPFGRWSAKSLFVKTDYIQGGNPKLDYGGILVEKRKVNGHTRTLQGTVGALGIEFNKSRNRSLDVFGYPDNDNYDGERELRCSARPSGTDDPGGAGRATTRLPCPAASASRGAGWQDGDSLFSVTSYTRKTDANYVFGPYFDNQAKQLFDFASTFKP